MAIRTPPKNKNAAPKIKIAAPPRRTNEQALEVSELRLICDEGKQQGVMSPQKALEMANERKLHLVEVKPSVEPTVWRLMAELMNKKETNLPLPTPKAEKGKWRKEPKKVKERKFKEVRMNDKLADHDMENKTRLIQGFLAKDKIVKVVVVNTGRKDGEISRAEALILQIIESCDEQATNTGVSGKRDTDKSSGNLILGVVATHLTPRGE